MLNSEPISGELKSQTGLPPGDVELVNTLLSELQSPRPGQKPIPPDTHVTAEDRAFLGRLVATARAAELDDAFARRLHAQLLAAPMPSGSRQPSAPTARRAQARLSLDWRRTAATFVSAALVFMTVAAGLVAWSGNQAVVRAATDTPGLPAPHMQPAPVEAVAPAAPSLAVATASGNAPRQAMTARPAIASTEFTPVAARTPLPAHAQP